MSSEELKKIIGEETKDLPNELLSEVVDFIQFIKSRKFNKTKGFAKEIDKELTGLDQSSLAHLEEEFLNYKEIYPREE